MGVQAVFGGEMAWYSEIDKGALKILTHRFPDVPNIGDITAVDWSTVEPVDILTGGSPCQDLSHAGKRAGMTEGTRSNLWVAMREAIAQLRPRLVIWENVRGAYSAEADSDLGSNPRLLADTRRRDGEPVLRALGRVLGDLSDLGYVGGWHGLRAADVGAPHGRFRVFVVAYATSNAGRFAHGDGSHAADASGVRRGAWWPTVAREEDGRRASTDVAGRGLLPTPRATDGAKGRGGPNQRGSSGDLMLPSAVALMGTPRASEWKGSGPVGSKSHEHMLSHEYLCAQVLLLSTPTCQAAKHSSDDRGPEMHDRQWGDYAAAIARWEHVLGRPAPAPTQTSAKGNPQLSAAFVEWMMGLPAGWVTDVPDITRNEALKALGNGVVPQQAEAAIRWLLARVAVAA
jgi:DNA (cytosine-5)-methyltransferase 1